MATNPPAMAVAMARLWVKFLPEIEQRVALLEDVPKALDAGSLSKEQHAAAHAAAHKLAGTLGTFGLNRGTDLARQIELELESTPQPESSNELAAWIVELRAVIDTRRQN